MEHERKRTKGKKAKDGMKRKGHEMGRKAHEGEELRATKEGKEANQMKIREGSQQHERMERRGEAMKGRKKQARNGNQR